MRACVWAAQSNDEDEPFTQPTTSSFDEVTSYDAPSVRGFGKYVSPPPDSKILNKAHSLSSHWTKSHATGSVGERDGKKDGTPPSSITIPGTSDLTSRGVRFGLV
ncbi:hypothetical protein PGQ11_003152 [Apiospora arundinis]|uniref:Uncharacterized protein n=1 Tax=Apiospora arundinis TaxID=335852 RepID=A0ABR2J4D0_9PEZI